MKRKLAIIFSVVLVLTCITGGIFAFANDNPDAAELTDKNCVIELSQSIMHYTGDKLTPDVSVKYNDGEAAIQLVRDVDYKVAFSDNVKIGKATATVSGLNDYKGDVTANFYIAPSQVKGAKMISTEMNAITVQWNSVSGATGYHMCVHDTDHNKWANYYFKPNVFQHRIIGLMYSSKCDIVIRAYTDIEGKNYYGIYSEKVTASTKDAIAKPAASGYCNLTSKPVVTWKSVKYAARYSIYRSTNKYSGFTWIANTDGKATSYTDKKAAVHKAYYYQVKAARKINNQFVYSRPSNAVWIKAKKTVFVGDSIMEGVKAYKAIPGANYVVKIGMGTYTFYEKNYFKVGKSTVTGVEKVISYKPDRVFIMFGMNEAAYKGNKGIIEYYEYAIEDIKDACKGVEIVILPVSPTTKNSGKTIPKKKRINSFNAAAKKMALTNGVKYYDFTAPYKDKNGYLAKKYNGGDGCHWNTKATKLFAQQMIKYAKANR